MPGYARQHLGWRDGSAELTVKLRPEAVVSGELIDATTGKPLDGLSHPPVLDRQADRSSKSTQPGDAGRFRLGELPEGTYSFSITTASGASLHQESLKLEPRQHIERKLRLKPAGR